MALRGDDALHLLMEEMSSQQGYHQKSGDLGCERMEESSQRRVRLTAEVEGYPPAAAAAAAAATEQHRSPTAGGMIWNPYVQVPQNITSSIPSAIRYPPTNPRVEVFRRRAYEKFKTDFRAVFELRNQNAMHNTVNDKNSKPSHLWGDLAIVSLLERWQFDAKLEEYLMISNNSNTVTDVKSTSSSTSSTVEIRNTVSRGRQSGLMDPILVSGNPFPYQSAKSTNKQKRIYRSPSAVLADEIKFEWIRSWRRLQGDSADISVLERVFSSKGFRKKVSKINEAVRNHCLVAESTLWNEISKRASLEENLSTKQSSKSHPKVTLDEEEEEVHVKFSGLSFRINQQHYRKLQFLFDRVHPSSTDEASHRAEFVSALFCLLARYDMLQGAGLQASMHGAVFDVLLRQFDCCMECFASPLNCRYERFCSAFPDTDSAFGSVGSFFDFDFATVGGCYQANPPFTTNFIKSMCEKMGQFLLDCRDKPLMFVVFVPAWDNTEGWKALRDSDHLTQHVTIAQESHFYCEGTQHRRKERYRVASFDTSIFFLQNDRARAQWPVTDTQVDELRVAFAKNPEEEDKHEPEEKGGLMKKAKRPSNEAAPQLQRHIKRTKLGTAATATKSPTERKRKNTKKQKQKRSKLLEDGKEGDQQLSILHSLGLG